MGELDEPDDLHGSWGATGRNGQELLSAWVPAEVAAAFRAWARGQAGGTSAALRALVAEATTGQGPPPPRGAGAGQRLTVRLPAEEAAALRGAAAARGVTPSSWVRALACAHLGRKPQWNREELDALREGFAELRRIGANLNQIARAMNAAAHTGQYPAYQGEAALAAAELVRAEMRRVVALLSGNWDYWGLPWAERPMPAPGAAEREDARAREEQARRRNRPRRRPRRFEDGAGADAGAGPAPAAPAAQPVLAVLSPVGERVAQNAVRQALAALPPQSPAQAAGLLQHARAEVLAREQAGEVFLDLDGDRGAGLP